MKTGEAIFPSNAHGEQLAKKCGLVIGVCGDLEKAAAHAETLRVHVTEVGK